jgi:hypothetical protein
MNKKIIVYLVAAGWLSAGWSLAAPDSKDPAAGESAPVSLPDLRVSAIAGAEGQYFVGLINQKTGQASLLRIGNQIAGYTITEIDPESKTVRLEKGGVPYRLELTGDSVQVVEEDPETAPSADDVKPGPVKSLAEFLKEHPELDQKPGTKAPVPAPEPVTPEEGLKRMAETAGKPFDPSMLKPRTFEDFVREHAPASNAPPASANPVE